MNTGPSPLSDPTVEGIMEAGEEIRCSSRLSLKPSQFVSLARHPVICPDNQSLLLASSFHLIPSVILLLQVHEFPHNCFLFPSSQVCVLDRDTYTLLFPHCYLQCPSSKSCLNLGDHIYSPMF